MKRRDLLKLLITLPLLACSRKPVSLGPTFPVRPPEPPPAKPDAGQLSKFQLGFGSCCLHDREQPIWKSVLAAKPDVFALLGDNIYADTEDMTVMARKYQQQKTNTNYAKFISQVPLIATWDDHDYGINDGGHEYPKKQESKNLLMDFVNESANSDRRKRDGVYSSYTYGDNNLKVQVLLLDLRWFRSPLKIDPNGHYVPHTDFRTQLLGEAQWAWLEKKLQEPADVRILGSSIQLLSADHRWEKWANFPHERKRLFDMIDRNNINNLLIISGDMHFAEITADQTPQGRRLVDFTSSGLTHSEPALGIPNSRRVQLFDTGQHFGLVQIEKKDSRVSLHLETRDLAGRRVLSHKFELT